MDDNFVSCDILLFFLMKLILITFYRGSYVSAHVSLNFFLLNELGKRDKCCSCQAFYHFFATSSGLQIYGGPGSLSHDFKIWPITFQDSGPSGPILFSCEKISP